MASCVATFASIIYLCCVQVMQLEGGHQQRVLAVAYTMEAAGLVSADCEGVVTVWQ